MTEKDDDDKVFGALASPARRRMMDALKDDPQTTSMLCAKFPAMSRCSVMQHLGVLEDAGLIVVRREGRYRWNYLNAIPIKRVYDRWIGEYATAAVNLLDRIKSDLEANPSPP